MLFAVSGSTGLKWGVGGTEHMLSLGLVEFEASLKHSRGDTEDGDLSLELREVWVK